MKMKIPFIMSQQNVVVVIGRLLQGHGGVFCFNSCCIDTVVSML
jgi:hypothetical protein